MTLVGMLACASEAHASADDARRLYEVAQTKIQELEYDEAAELLSEAIVTEGVDDQTLKDAHFSLGKVEVIRRNLDGARYHFVWVLRRYPDYEVNADEPQKIRTFFDQHRDEAAGGGGAPVDTVAPDRASTSPSSAAGPQTAAIPADAEAEAPPEDGGGKGLYIGIGAGAAAAVVVAALAGAVGVAAFLLYRDQPSAGAYSFRTE